jgi:hypothetical protein
MVEIVGTNPSDGNLVNLDGAQVSMKLVQSIYNEITGRKESLSQYLKDAHEIYFEDINQLDNKINQLYEQYNIVSKSCSIKIFHVNDCKETFSSFERFKLYDSSSMSPCENIRLEYNFLIVLPNTKAPQNYNIKIDLISRAGLREKENAEGGFSRGIFRLAGLATGNIEIEYIDYTVARNFLVAIDHWYKSIKKNPLPKWLIFTQNNSEYIPFIFQVLSFGFVSYSIYKQAELFVSQTPSITTLFSGLIAASAALFIVAIVALRVGRICEYAIDFYSPISFVNLNRGDKKAIEDFRKSNIIRLAFAIGSMFFSVALSVLATYISKILNLT